ncbi:MAG TPA: hypothetical protein VGM57_16050 [Pseudolabrys sp.]|jgi:hypothetical protein
MSDDIRPIRRIVTGNDAQGRSCVLFDSAAPNVRVSPYQKGTSMTDIWVFDRCPADISGSRDDGNLPFNFEPPANGGHLRVVQSAPKPKDYDAATDRFITAKHQPEKKPGGKWERGGQSLYTTRIHKSEALDYGIMLSGERVLVTDDGERPLGVGAIVVQVGSWHAWSNPNKSSEMAFVMSGARFED